jgi:hypothetical protein
MSTIRFDHQDELDSLIARIYLDTNHKFSKKELLEVIFELGTQDYQLLLKKIREPKTNVDSKLRKRFIENFSGALSIPNVDVDDTNPKLIWEKEVV